MNRTRCFLVGAALATASVLQPPANAQGKTVKDAPRVDLGGLTLGDRTVAKGDAKSRSKQRTLFGVLGNPTAVVIPSAGTKQDGVENQSSSEGVPEWAQGVITKVDKDHVLWLYRRPKHALAFLVNREGIIEAITIARTK